MTEIMTFDKLAIRSDLGYFLPLDSGWWDMRSDTFDPATAPVRASDATRRTYVECAEGDKFIVNGVAGGYSRIWMFVAGSDAEQPYEVLAQSTEVAATYAHDARYEIVTAPQGAAMFASCAKVAPNDSSDTAYDPNFFVYRIGEVMDEEYVESMTGETIGAAKGDNVAWMIPWEQGTFKYNTGKTVQGATRIRTKFLDVEQGVGIYLAVRDGFDLGYYDYASDGTFIDDHTWFNGFYFENDGSKKYKLLARKANNANITPQEAGDVLDAFVYSLDTMQIDVFRNFWEQGSISPSTGNVSVSDYRCRTVGAMFLDDAVYGVNVARGYLVDVYEYETGGAYNGRVAHTSTPMEFAADSTKRYRFVVYKEGSSGSSGETISVAEANDAVCVSKSTYALAGGSDSDGFSYELLQARHVVHDSTPSTVPLTLVQFSDVHLDGVALQKVSSFAERNASRIDGIICTGDMVNNFDDSFGFWDSYLDDKCLLVIGNHEGKIPPTSTYPWNDASSYKPMSDIYDKYLASRIQSWGAQYSSGKTYYYKDYNSAVRVIVLDLSTDQLVNESAQLAWFESALADARASGLAVIVAQHFVPANPIPISGAGNWYGETHNNIQTAYWRVRDVWHDAVKDFKQGGGAFVCWLGGHTHNDFMSVNSDYPDQLFVTVGTVSPLVSGNWSDIDQEDVLANVVTVDTLNSIVKVLRYGDHLTRCFNSHKFFAWNYGTGDLITSR